MNNDGLFGNKLVKECNILKIFKQIKLQQNKIIINIFVDNDIWIWYGFDIKNIFIICNIDKIVIEIKNDFDNDSLGTHLMDIIESYINMIHNKPEWNNNPNKGVSPPNIIQLHVISSLFLPIFNINKSPFHLIVNKQ